MRDANKEKMRKARQNRKSGLIETQRAITLDASTEGSQRFQVIDQNLHNHAEKLIEMLHTKVKNLGNLSTIEKAVLYEYFDKFCPLVGRILDLHCNLPLSSLQLRPPTKIDNPILTDYIFSVYNEMIEKTKLNEILHTVTRNYWKFGIGALAIFDDFEFDKDITSMDYWDLDNVSKMLKDRVEDSEILDKIGEITSKYINDPISVTLDEKNYVIEKFIPVINKDYKGIKKLKVIDPFDVIDRESNEDIDYFQYPMNRSESLDKILNQLDSTNFRWTKGSENTITNEQRAYKLGYPKSLVKLHIISKEKTVTIDTDPYNDIGAYAVSMERTGDRDIDNSILNRIIEPIISIIIGKRKQRELINLSTKVTRLIKAPMYSDEQMQELESQFIDAAESDEGAIITTNTENVTVDDLNLDARESLNIQDILDQETKDIINSLGMTESLVGGEDSYGNSFVKIELLVNEYTAFRHILVDFIENQIFKPIAFKLGFITKDAWGRITPIIPEVSFDRLSIARGTEDFNMLLELANSGKLPWENIYKALGFNIQDVENKLLREKTSIINDATSELLSNTVSELGERLKDNPDITKRVEEALVLKEPLKEAKDEDDDDIDNFSNEQEAEKEQIPVNNMVIRSKLSTQSKLAFADRLKKALAKNNINIEIDEDNIAVNLLEVRNQLNEINIPHKKEYKGKVTTDSGIATIKVIYLKPIKKRALLVELDSDWISRRHNYLASKYKTPDMLDEYKPMIVIAQGNDELPLDLEIPFTCGKLSFIGEEVISLKGKITL